MQLLLAVLLLLLLGLLVRWIVLLLLLLLDASGQKALQGGTAAAAAVAGQVSKLCSCQCQPHQGEWRWCDALEQRLTCCCQGLHGVPVTPASGQCTPDAAVRSPAHVAGAVLQHCGRRQQQSLGGGVAAERRSLCQLVRQA